jgi:probable F420-dependent oxidoreductase
MTEPAPLAQQLGLNAVSRQKGELQMSEYRPFRFGLIVHRADSKDDWVAKAKRAEDTGYAILLATDHFGNQFAPIPALMAAAEATTTLRLGSFVFDNDFRHPVVLAKEAATIDVLTDGRFELGLGAGWRRREYEQSGISFDAASVRVERVEESLRIIKGLFSDRPVDFTGKYYTITHLEGFPKPVQRPHPPILIGGNGKRMLSIASRGANIVGLDIGVPGNGRSLDLNDVPATMEQKLTWIRQSAGDRFNELELNIIVFGVVVTDCQHEAAQQAVTSIRAIEGYGATAEQLLDSPHFLIGSVDQICEELLSYREKYGISYISVYERDMDAFTPIIARLAGK